MKHCRIWFKRCMLVGLALIVVPMVCDLVFFPGTPEDSFFSVLGMVGFFMVLVPVLVMVGALFVGAAKDVNHEWNVAAQPVPTPQQIAAALAVDYGRPATIEEVAAAHQLLTSRRNEALVFTGAALGGLYLVGRQFK